MKILHSRPYSTHPEDIHLRVIASSLESNQATPWVTWVHNPKDGARFWGHYFRSQEEMEKDYRERNQP